jgi:hypothetical protein
MVKARYIVAAVLLVSCADDDEATPTTGPAATALATDLVEATTAQATVASTSTVAATTTEQATTAAPTTTEAPTTTIPLNDYVATRDACDEIGQTGQYTATGFPLLCIEAPVPWNPVRTRPRWAVLPEPMDQATQVAVVKCARSFTFIDTTDILLRNRLDWSDCDEADVLLTTEGSDYAEAVRAELQGCRDEKSAYYRRYVFGERRPPRGEKNRLSEVVTECEVMLEGMASA